MYFQLYDSFVKKPAEDNLSRTQLLHTLAAGSVGESNAAALLDAWLALDRIQRDTAVLNYGGTIFYLGSVQQRWLTRPFVPFPDELTPEETQDYRKFEFQARTEDRARNLDETQGTHQYQGLGGKALTDKLLVRMLSELNRARGDVHTIRQSADLRQRYELLDQRLRVFEALVNNCRDAIDYQYDLDTIKGWRLSRPVENQQELTDIPEWLAIREVARRELDNSSVLIDLLRSQKEPLIDLAKTPEEENIRVLGPNLVDQLRKKMRIMIAHWEEYEKLFIKEDGKAANSTAIPRE